MPRNCTPCGPYSVCSSTNSGISVLQPTHHVAQKFRTITFPLKSASLTFVPVVSLSVKFSFAGAGFALHTSSSVNGTAACAAAAIGASACATRTAAGSPEDIRKRFITGRSPCSRAPWPFRSDTSTRPGRCAWGTWHRRPRPCMGWGSGCGSTQAAPGTSRCGCPSRS